MNYISYQPAFDVYHTEFRLLRISKFSGLVEINVEQLRIVDFYLLFFSRLVDVRLAPAHKKIKLLAKKLARDTYEMQPDDRLLFARMGVIQAAAFRGLAAGGVIDKGKLAVGLLSLTGEGVSLGVDKRIAEVNAEDEEKMSSLDVLLTQYEISGKNGLKDRTSLMEYKYDAV